MKTFEQWTFQQLNESASTNRYSVEINYRTNAKEVLEGFAKLALGFVSAVLKNHDYHVKQVFDAKPIRILISTRNWDDGEWAGIVTWNDEHRCFVVSKGFYNKDRNTVSIQKSEKCSGDSAAEIAKHLMNYMHNLQDKPDRSGPKLNPVPLKRGPK